MSEDTREQLSAVFGSIERRGPWTVPERLGVRVKFGSAELDLREATLGPGTTTIDVSIAFGSLELTIPPDLAVEVHVSSIAGSVEDTRRAGTTSAAKAGGEAADGSPYRIADATNKQRVVITGTTKFGSCEIIALERGQNRRDLLREKHRGRRHRHRDHHMSRFERHMERHAETSERHRERLAVFREERELWHGEGRRWLPWWMQARMRRRIFLWFGIALAIGTIAGTRFHHNGHPHWWLIPGLIILWGASGAVAWRMTRPLILAVKAARDIGDGKFDTRVSARGGGEMKVLADAINEMAVRIEQQIKDQRQLLAAVSHELRTPLGHMRVLIETARETGDAAAAPASRKALDELEREVLTVDDLVGRLLAQSRLEFGNLDRRPVDLGELVTDVATSAGLAPEIIEAIGDVNVAADLTLVRRAVANLIDNARTHGKGAVAVRIERRDGQVAIEIDDAGPGVTADRRADAFRAFVPSSGGGLGLGLALVSRIAKAHDGKAWITDRPGGGARVGFTVAASG